MGRHFPIRTRYFEDSKAHWRPDWILGGILFGTGLAIVLLVLFWLFGH